ncbi:hypothetical protein [Catenuloplanes japonicus]|uniref:hypothetical protein n=1 Tax=Catenuloplanes japonicus TaxID=33876 RepID=UPI000524D6E9|nr:hypothetical protein [Catenuloplanes japonicus]
MRRFLLIGALAVLLGGCGVRPSGVITTGEAPTGVAPGVTLYFVTEDGALAPQLRETGRLGTIPEALALLLDASPQDAGLHTEIEAHGVTRVVADTEPGLIILRLPLADYELTPRGIDQIVCTTLGVAIQRGEPRTTRVRTTFTLPTPASDPLRTCPLTGS